MTAPGILYIVATPIGNLEDLSPRAQKILSQVDKIAAEDTRHSQYLLNHFQIQTPTLSLHDFNETQRTEQILDLLSEGHNIALISDAGTPLISDPGYRLVATAQQNNIRVVPIPGPCALIAALSAAGLPTNSFIFAGFLPAKTHARQKALEDLKNQSHTLIFYESPHRVIETIADMIAVFGPQRRATITRELTKNYETIKQGTLLELDQWLTQDHNQQKGEFVILITGVTKQESDLKQQQALAILKILLAELPVSQAVKLATKITEEKKSWLYEQALALTQK